MSVKIELPPDVEANLAAQAAAQGILCQIPLRRRFSLREHGTRRQDPDPVAGKVAGVKGQEPAHAVHVHRGDQAGVMVYGW
jgi:hypothetical protein